MGFSLLGQAQSMNGTERDVYEGAGGQRVTEGTAGAARRPTTSSAWPPGPPRRTLPP
jgi:hypothetical protein